MDEILYEFLKDKGCEFCYKDKEPFLLDTKVPYEWLTEYYELLIKKLNWEYVEICEECNGNGSECKKCNGKGFVKIKRLN